jgi:HD-GYP domain-containing protein (c-di-GMP phosphodiesterase class II)
MAPKRKAEVFHASAIGLTRDVLTDPKSRHTLETASELVRGSAQLLLEGRPGFHAFLRMVGKDSNFYAHSINVCTYGIALARAAGLPFDRLAELGIGLLLHDLGMVGVPEEVVNKRGALTDQEWEVIRGHPERGLGIYNETGGASDVARAVILTHHERMDGTGYPRGLRGPSIPLVGRIASTVNIFDALTTTRPYRPALSTYAALTCMKQELRSAIDQDLLDHFIRFLGPG